MFYQANLTPWALFTFGTGRFEVRFSAFHLLSDGSRPPIGDGHDTITNLISVIQQVDRPKTTRPALIRGVNVGLRRWAPTSRLIMVSDTSGRRAISWPRTPCSAHRRACSSCVASPGARVLTSPVVLSSRAVVRSTDK